MGFKLFGLQYNLPREHRAAAEFRKSADEIYLGLKDMGVQIDDMTQTTATDIRERLIRIELNLIRLRVSGKHVDFDAVFPKEAGTLINFQIAEDYIRTLKEIVRRKLHPADWHVTGLRHASLLADQVVDALPRQISPTTVAMKKADIENHAVNDEFLMAQMLFSNIPSEASHHRQAHHPSSVSESHHSPNVSPSHHVLTPMDHHVPIHVDHGSSSY